MFDEFGRKIPTAGDRVFSEIRKSFYKLDGEINLSDYIKFHNTAISVGMIFSEIPVENAYQKLIKLYKSVELSNHFKNILRGPFIPFSMKLSSVSSDIGTQIEDFFLKNVKNSFENQYPQYAFKATLQGREKLLHNMSVSPQTKYTNFMKKVSDQGVYGLYFPTALQGYDILSQQKAVMKIPEPEDFDVCVSGHIEASYALTVKPGFLKSSKSYAPILCLSAIQHRDKRLVPLFKSYGPHLEFWLMSQMMSPNVTQVSEQWAGGLTVYNAY